MKPYTCLMETQLTEFIRSDAGFIAAWVLLVFGLSDLLTTIFVMRYRPDLLPMPATIKRNLLTGVSFYASFFVLLGLYMLYLRR